MTTVIHMTRYPSPLGDLLLASVGGKLVHLDFEDNDARMRKRQGRRFGNIDWRHGDRPSPAVTGWLDAYFAGLVTTPPLEELDMNGNDFQKSVWFGLSDIPCGKTISYRQQAIKLGMAKAVRAVAHANALNPISILVPCHPCYCCRRLPGRLCRRAFAQKAAARSRSPDGRRNGRLKILTPTRESSKDSF